MKMLKSAVLAFIADEDGVTAIEYGLIASLIGVVMVAAAGEVGHKINNAFQYVADHIIIPGA